MAYYFLFPEKDTTIYSHPYRTDLNTGRVETLSLTTEVGNDDKNHYPSRFLLKFKDSEIKTVIVDKISGSLSQTLLANGSSSLSGSTEIPFSSSLKIYSTEFSNNLPTSQVVELYPLTVDWDNGTQRYIDHPYQRGVVSDGTSWEYRDNGTLKNPWPNATTGQTSSYTGSNIGGGTWWTGSGFESSQSITIVDNFDLNFNVTSQIKKYSSSLFSSLTWPDGIPNRGFIVKREDDVDLSTNDGTLKYFSLDTHTIFSPTLIFKWDDSMYITGSDNILNSGKIQLTFSNLKKEYKQSEEPTLRLNVRKQFPVREFTTSSNYLKLNYLTQNSYYSIEDYTSKEVIVPFDTEFTKLSADKEGMYFKLYMQGLQPERYYRLLIRHDNNDGTNIYDNDSYFKVTR